MDASPILCGGVTVYKALKNSGIRKDSWVVLPGAAGGLDHLAIQYARAMGFRVVAIDSGAKKVILCNELGADVFIDFAETSNVVDAVIKATGGGAHCAIVTPALSGHTPMQSR
ncbi:MAG: Alcohol dehydrogenase [Cyphobasidiales sp. Tagirdzhanova-0007]|nr:MAG: Alcohol dehydrogenase [Cyphobasidiales sp. Tagirdzhanova-0007]